MALDPQAQMLVDQMAAADEPSLHTPSPAQARADARAFPLSPGPGVAKVDDHLASGFEGEITARIYTPEGTGPFPLLVWFHGGGWLQRYKPLIEDGKTIVASPHKVYGPENNDVTQQFAQAEHQQGHPGRNVG